jgi:hypothetical protein
MDKETAKLALEFLGRVDLKGVEVPAFVQVFNALKADANAPDKAPEPSEAEPK